MSLGSALTSVIDIDFTRARGSASKGRIMFQPPRQKLGSTMLSDFPDPVTLEQGKALVTLPRLPAGTYRVIEQIDNQKERVFDFALPLTAPAVVEYEDIVEVWPVPARYTSVKTINGVSPDPTTGNIIVETGETSPGTHNHTSSDVTDFISTVDSLVVSRIADLVGSAPATLDTLSELANALGGNENFAADVIALLATKAALSHGHAISDIVGLQAALDAIGNRALPDRIIRISDHSKQAGAANTYDMPNTDSAWALFTGGPPEYTIAASVGDDIEVVYNYLIAGATTSFVDLAVVTGATPTPQRYLSSGIATPSFQGSSGNYPSDAAFQGRSGVLGFTVESTDLDSGNIRLRWMIKTSTVNGKIYANDNYPLMLRIRNKRLSGI